MILIQQEDNCSNTPPYITCRVGTLHQYYVLLRIPICAGSDADVPGVNCVPANQLKDTVELLGKYRTVPTYPIIMTLVVL